MSHLEIEYKALLTQQQFNDLNNYFNHSQTIHQINHYFLYLDPSVHISCRIRQIDTTFTLTFKQDHTVGKLETNFIDIDFTQPFIRQDVQTFLIENNLNKPFTLIGSLTTIRHLTLEDHCEICLDENNYCGISDYELEVESIDDPFYTQALFNKICDEFELIENSASKFKRFLVKKGLL